MRTTAAHPPRFPSRRHSQEDMISFGYTVRYWQRIEAGKPITLRTLLRICRIMGATAEAVVRGLGPEVAKKPAKR